MRAALALLVVMAVLARPVAASADDHGPVTAGDDDFNVSIQHVSPAEALTPDSSQQTLASPDAQDEVTPCDVNEICSNLVCVPDQQSPLGGMYVYQDGAAPPLNLGWCSVDQSSPAAVTPGIVAAAFRRLPLPASDLQVQPPNGRTLVNFDTNFYTDNGEFTRTVRLLGQRVELRIWPARYGWRFGDGEQRWTTTPGDQYPHLEVTHRYLRKGRVSPSVDTTYAAQFRVNGGPWRDVNGTVTIPGAPEALRVVTARPVLVGG